MAIKQEELIINGRTFTKTYSDNGRYVVRDEVEYGEAIDPTEFGRVYTEGNIIENNPNSQAETILNIILGENDD